MKLDVNRLAEAIDAVAFDVDGRNGIAVTADDAELIAAAYELDVEGDTNGR